MLKSLELENFKAFGERVKIDFAPITLIFGENSAGKSSILQSLSLLKQTRESREHGALLLPRSDTGTVDLGSFQELLFDHDQQKTLSIRITLDPESSTGPQQKLPRFWTQEARPSDNVSFETRFAWPRTGQEVELTELTVGKAISNALNSDFARFKPHGVSEAEMRQWGGPFLYVTRGRRSAWDSVARAARCTWVTDSDEHWDAAYAAMKKSLNVIQKSLKVLQEHVSRGREVEGVLDTDDSRDSKEKLAHSVFDAIEFYSTLPERSAFIRRLREGQIGRQIPLDGFLPMGPFFRHSMLPEQLAVESHSSHHASQTFGIDVTLLCAVVGSMVESTLEGLFPMGPFRRPPERWYIYTGTKPSDVGYKGELLPDLLFRSPGLVKDTNKWLKRLDIGYEIDLRPVGERWGDLFEVRLKDTRRSPSIDVALSDVGFGISQLLPFIVQSLATQHQIISIEQPEVHIHPRLQADLGDLLAEAISKPRHHRFIIETHSEHLMLRLQRLIRDSRLAANDVSIIYVSRGASGAKISRLRLDDDGEFVDDWPGGFFPERLRELS